MRKEKVKEIIEIYRAKLKGFGIRKIDYPHDKYLDDVYPEKHALAHCHGMLDQMEVFIEENKIDKVDRWLGFIQGILWEQQIYTLEELKDHNRD